MTDWKPLGIAPATFLLPKAQHLNPYWPIIACDQYTSQPDIWQEVDREVAQRPSTLRLIVPEAFLEETQTRNRQVLEAMTGYLAEGLLEPQPEGFVLVKRETQSGKRVGLVTVIDLEHYDYREGSTSLIRATEQTVLERIPPRLEIREQAAIELSHVLLLVDDPQDSLLGPLYAARQNFPKLYDMALLMDGGHIRGWLVAKGKEQTAFAQALALLKENLQGDTPLFAVGDGNHSLAAAKANWEKRKAGLSEDEQQNHPARYATVELMNLHSPALLFEPIHRVAFQATHEELLDLLAPLSPRPDAENPDITLVTQDKDLPLALPGVKGQLVVDAVQRLLDEAKLSLDYVHGVEALRDIVTHQNAVGILMPDFPKDQLFPTVQREGRLPRKTFSMGEANEKRFYMEARRIT